MKTRSYSIPTDRRYWTETPRTMRQAADQRAHADAQSELRYRTAAPAPRLVATDPRIGELCKEGRQVFYAYIGGEYFEGTLAAVEGALA